MFIDALDLNGSTYLHIPVKLVSLFGPSVAMYCSEALAIIRRAVSNEHSSLIIEDSDGQQYVKMDRRYIQGRIGLSADEQAAAESILEQNSLLIKHPTISNAIMIDGQRIVALIVGHSAEEFDAAMGSKVETAIKSVTPKASNAKKAARTKLLKNIKNHIEARTDLDSDISKAVLEWSGEVLKYRLLSYKMVDTFIADVLSYNDKDKALKVIATAASYGMATAEEAAAKLLYKTNIMEEINSTTISKKGAIRKLKHERATADDLGEDSF